MSNQEPEDWESILEQEDTVPVAFPGQVVALKASNFPPQYKTSDINHLFGVAIQYIQWENDTTCIAYFDSPGQCKQAYINSVNSKNIKITPYSTFRTDRPVTTDLVARRMIAGALGLKAKKRTEKQIEDDRKKIDKEIRERGKKNLERRKKQLDSSWD